MTKITGHRLRGYTVAGHYAVEVVATQPPDPHSALRGEHVFQAPREQWIALAKELLRQLDPVERDEVPLLLKRIAEALE